MYIPKHHSMTERKEIIAFMQRFNFATLVSISKNKPIATHLPFVIIPSGNDICLISHFAKANEQWRDRRWTLLKTYLSGEQVKLTL